MKIKLAALLCLFIILILTACSDNQSYASLLQYDDQLYVGKDIVDVEQYPSKSVIGVIEEQVNADTAPQKNLSANELKVGTQIYIIDKDLLAADFGNGKMKIFSPSD